MFFELPRLVNNSMAIIPQFLLIPSNFSTFKRALLEDELNHTFRCTVLPNTKHDHTTTTNYMEGQPWQSEFNLDSALILIVTFLINFDFMEK